MRTTTGSVRGMTTRRHPRGRISPMFPHPAIISTDDVAEATLPVDGGHSGARLDEAHDTMLSVLEGVVYVVAGDDEVALTPGDFVTIRAGVVHRWWNAGDEEARLLRRGAAGHATLSDPPARAPHTTRGRR